MSIKKLSILICAFAMLNTACNKSSVFKVESDSQSSSPKIIVNSDVNGNPEASSGAKTGEANNDSSDTSVTNNLEPNLTIEQITSLRDAASIVSVLKDLVMNGSMLSGELAAIQSHFLFNTITFDYERSLNVDSINQNQIGFTYNKINSQGEMILSVPVVSEFDSQNNIYNGVHEQINIDYSIAKIRVVTVPISDTFVKHIVVSSFESNSGIKTIKNISVFRDKKFGELGLTKTLEFSSNSSANSLAKISKQIAPYFRKVKPEIIEARASELYLNSLTESCIASLSLTRPNGFAHIVLNIRGAGYLEGEYQSKDSLSAIPKNPSLHLAKTTAVSGSLVNDTCAEVKTSESNLSVISANPDIDPNNPSYHDNPRLIMFSYKDKGDNRYRSVAIEINKQNKLVWSSN